MHLKTIFLASVAAMSFASTANALTLQQAMSEVAGYHCSGSTCTSSETISTTVTLPDVVTNTDNPDIVTIVDNPDIVTSSEKLVSPGVEGNAPTWTANPVAGCFTTFMGGNGKLIPATNVNADCVPLSLNPGKGGSPAVYQTVTTTTDGGTTEVITDGGITTVVTPGGTAIVDSCQTTTKELSYNGPHTDRANAWSVSSSSSSSDGSC